MDRWMNTSGDPHQAFVADCQGRQHRDNADAAMVEAMRYLGRRAAADGSRYGRRVRRVYEQRIARFLRGRGY